MNATNRTAAVDPSFVDRWKESCRVFRERMWDEALAKDHADMTNSLFESLCRAFFAAFPDEAVPEVQISDINGWFLVECTDRYGCRLYELDHGGSFYLSSEFKYRPRLTVIKGGRAA